jgi:RHS repeat-associated protein
VEPRPDFSFAISNTPTGLGDPLYDFRGGPRSSGYFRDAETGLDYAKARYHQPGMGRFMSPDPYMALSTGASNPNNPGSWNRYAYVGGDPVNFVDRRGLYLECTDDDCDESDDETCSPGYYWSDYDQACEPIQNKRKRGNGLGSVQVQKSYDIDTQCQKSAASVISDIDSTFSTFGNYTGPFASLTTTLAFNVPSGGISTGAVIQIPHTTLGVTVTYSVTVTQSSATSFTFATNPGHPLDATITFTAQDMGNGFVGFDISINGQTANAFWSAFFAAAGSSFEDGVWNHFLDQVIADCSKKN